LVLEYFLESGEFEALETFSVRGLPRPEDDAHIGVSTYSDPLHAVWGRRRRPLCLNGVPGELGTRLQHST
jgi:hypothetical protein